MCLLALCVVLAEWGVGSPSTMRCGNVQEWSALNATLLVSTCKGLQPRFSASILRANDVQTVGTHNSYHIAPRFAVTKRWKYTHVPLQLQLDKGVRSLELDPHYDPFSRAFGVYHEPFVDSQSRCGCLQDCMREIAAWSACNPQATMLKIVIEPKFNIDMGNPYRGSHAKAHMHALQSHLMAEWPAGKVLTPAMVQGDAPSLREALKPGSCGWPSDAETRGMAMFILDVWQENADAGDALRALPEQERLFFLRGSHATIIDESDVAVVELAACECSKEQDLDACTEDMRRLAADGYIVRAATDVAGCKSSNITALIEATLRAGVQILTTDFPTAASLPCGTGRTACCRPDIVASCTAENAHAEVHVITQAETLLVRHSV
jgi:Phosphoinositide phospholipase C, Ca2+-dependent